MKSLTFFSMLTLAVCVISVCYGHEDESGVRRRDSIALFRGFLCYIRGVALADCKTDREVGGILRRLDGDEDMSSYLQNARLSVRPSGPRFPLPPPEARKRDAFYSDWRR